MVPRNDYSDFSAKGVSRVSVFHSPVTKEEEEKKKKKKMKKEGTMIPFHPHPVRVPFFDPFSGREELDGSEKREGSRRKVQSWRNLGLATPSGHRVNTVLPTINSLLPCFLTPCASRSATEAEKETGREENEGELPRGWETATCFSSPFRGSLRNLSSFFFSSFSFTSEVHLPSVFYFISPFFPRFFLFFSPYWILFRVTGGRTRVCR